MRCTAFRSIISSLSQLFFVFALLILAAAQVSKFDLAQRLRFAKSLIRQFIDSFFAKDGVMRKSTTAGPWMIVLLLAIKLGAIAIPCHGQGTLSRVSGRVHDSNNNSSGQSNEQQPETEESESVLGSIVGAVFNSSDKKRRKKQTGARNRRRPTRNRRCRGDYPPNIHVYEHLHYVHPQPDYIYQPVVPVVPPTGPALGSDELLITEGADNPVFQESVVGDLVDESNDWWLRLTALLGSNFDELNHGGLGLLIQAPGGLGLDVSVTSFRESGLNFRDQLWLGDVNVVLEAVTGDVRGRLGIGVNWMSDRIGGEAGLNLTAGVDVKFSERWLGAGEIDFGSLGSTDLFHTQISLGYRVQRSEIIAGYDYYNIGGTGIDGWFVGLRIRY